MATGIKFQTRVEYPAGSGKYSYIRADVYVGDVVVGWTLGTIISRPANPAATFILKSPGFNDLEVTVAIVSGTVVSKTYTMVMFWKPLTGTVWTRFNPYNYVSCNFTAPITNGYVSGNVCSFDYNLVINWSLGIFDARVVPIKTSLTAYIDKSTSDSVSLISAVPYDSQYESKLRELLTAYKLKFFVNEEISPAMLSIYETPLKAAQAEIVWYWTGCYRDAYSLMGNVVHLWDVNAASKFKSASTKLSVRAQVLFNWMQDYIATSSGSVLSACIAGFTQMFNTNVDSYLSGITTVLWFIDSVDLRDKFDDITVEFNKYLDDQFKILTDSLGSAANLAESLSPLRVSAKEKLNQFLIGSRPIIRLTGNFNIPSNVNWSGVNQIGVEINNVGGKVFNGWFGFKFVDDKDNEYVYNVTPTVVPSVVPGETKMINTDIPFDTMFPNGSPGRLRIKLIPVRSDT